MGAQPGNNAPWPPYQIEKIKALWAEGKTTGEIARMIPGRSRSAISGMARRLNLASRVSPIHKATTNATGSARRSLAAPHVKGDKYAGNSLNARKGRPPKPGAQNRPGAVFGAMGATTAEEADAARAKATAAGARMLAAFAAPANDTSIPLMGRGAFQCSWPLGEPDRPANQLCCGQRVVSDANRSVATYCAEHAARAVARVLQGGKPDVKLYERSLRRYAA